VTYQTIELDTSDGRMPLYEAIPDDQSSVRGAVVVFQEAFGVNDYIEDVARRLAGEGYRAVAPHLFHRSGGGTIPYDDFSKVLVHFEELSDDAFLADIDATLNHLASAGFTPKSIGTVGFCMGGRVSFLAATRRPLGAAVSFYGGGIVTARSDRLPSLVGGIATMDTPWLGLFGDKDKSIPIEDVEALRKALGAEAQVDTEVVRYADAEHGFHCHARPSYNAEAATDAWQQTLRWFETHLST
jgi:carboxymethylenebutenolidase